LLLDLAAQEPELTVTLLWRPFGGKDESAALDLVRRRQLPNVEIMRRRVPDMHRLYEQYHFTVAPFRSVGKPCPNSVLESLAVGRPALVSDSVDISTLVAGAGAGVSFAPTAEGIRGAFHRLCRDYADLQSHARPCAERYFDERQTVRAYAEVYGNVVK
jgi:glycosyltransferase involved in cell wall biosynthesis